jgi:hypothetical protein
MRYSYPQSNKWKKKVNQNNIICDAVKGNAFVIIAKRKLYIDKNKTNEHTKTQRERNVTTVSVQAEVN